uniref:Chromogranin-A n=1 Tax=Canis lupus familiaris TaxID=9615 RepID=A0A8C0T450_CANLF
MRSAAVLALLLCAGQAIALPVSSPVNKGDTEVMKCIVEVISDTLSKPSPMPVSQECFETLRGDERILSILRHQNLLKELQDLALQGAKERAIRRNTAVLRMDSQRLLTSRMTRPSRKVGPRLRLWTKPGRQGLRRLGPLRERESGSTPGRRRRRRKRRRWQRPLEASSGAGRTGSWSRNRRRSSSPRTGRVPRMEDGPAGQGADGQEGLQGEDEDDDPDRSMKLSFRARAYDFRGPGLPLRRGWRPTSREDSVEASLPLQVRGYVEEKKEEEGSANRRPEDQELETLMTIEAELEKVAQQLQALLRG